MDEGAGLLRGKGPSQEGIAIHTQTEESQEGSAEEAWNGWESQPSIWE